MLRGRHLQRADLHFPNENEDSVKYTHVDVDDLEVVKEKIFKYSQDPYAYFYTLNFCAYALSRACTIVGLTPEMAFRAMDIEGKAQVKEDEFATFFREVLSILSLTEGLNPS